MKSFDEIFLLHLIFDISTFCLQFIDNSFTLTSIILDHIGIVFVPPAAFINHSCTPNAVVVFPEGGEGAGSTAGKEWVKVIAIKSIEPGEEVGYFYISPEKK
jgi:SET and MYND domain-containing protein